MTPQVAQNPSILDRTNLQNISSAFRPISSQTHIGNTIRTPPLQRPTAHYGHQLQSPILYQPPNEASALQASNAATHHLIRLELFRRSNDAFSGEPHKYHSWVNLITHKTKNLNLDPWDVLTVLQVNTAGKPQKLLETHMATGGANPSKTLSDVWEALHEQFGSGSRIATSLRNQIKDFKPIPNIHHSEKLSELISICQLILVNMEVAEELKIYDLSIGIGEIWEKLAEPHQNAWRVIVAEQKAFSNGRHPSFKMFVEFLQRKSKELNDPCYEKKLVPLSLIHI